MKHRIVNSLNNKFGDRIISLIGYGSYYFERSTNCNDIDLCMLLDERQEYDFDDLHKLIRSSYPAIDITVHYLNEIERKGWQNFTHGTHGIFFLKHLAHSELLLGDDIFARKSILISQKKYSESLAIQINQYIDRIQNYLIKESDKNQQFFQKYFTRILIDILLLNADISFREINKSSNKKISEYFIEPNSIFSDDTKKIHRKLLKQGLKSQEITTLLSLITDDIHKLNNTSEHKL